jgi:hypothetical protein
MSKKSEKLARELVGLVSKYSDADIDAALELIGDGDLFARLRPAVRTAKAKVPSATKPSRGLSLRDIVKATKHASDNLPPHEGSQLLDLLKKLDNAELLRSAASLRAYADRIGLALPAKQPARAVVVRRIIDHLASIPIRERTELISSAELEVGTQSSLKGWSDLIVRRKD